MLEKSFAELEQFSYIASHDLKSPLRTIARYAGLLRRRYSGELDVEANEFIDYIVKGASHMNDIIRDLLEYSGISKFKGAGDSMLERYRQFSEAKPQYGNQ